MEAIIEQIQCDWCEEPIENDQDYYKVVGPLGGVEFTFHEDTCYEEFIDYGLQGR